MMDKSKLNYKPACKEFPKEEGSACAQGKNFEHPLNVLKVFERQLFILNEYDFAKKLFLRLSVRLFK